MGAEQDAQSVVHLGLKTLENRLHVLFAQCIPLLNSLHIIFFFPHNNQNILCFNTVQETVLVAFFWTDMCSLSVLFLCMLLSPIYF